MSLQGKGTKTNPYMIYSYSDFVESTSAAPEEGEILHLKLGGNINCEDYGNQFLWKTIKYKDYVVDIDLNDCYIKNAYITQDNALFIFDAEPTTYYNRVYGGDILNVFSRNARYLFYTNKAKSTVHFYKVRFSVNLNSIIREVFYGCLFDTCSFYLYCDDNLFANSETTSNSIFRLLNEIPQTSTILPKVEAAMSKCDIQIDLNIKKVINRIYIFYPFSDSYSNIYSMKDCRVQGMVNSNIAQIITGNYGWSSFVPYIDSCVFNIDSYNTGQSIGYYTQAPYYNSYPRYSSLNVTKNNIAYSTQFSMNLVLIPESKLTDAEYLKSIYFPVERLEE